MLRLADSREIRFPGSPRIATPLLVPSFSSRVPKIEKPFRASEEFIDGPILVSAYDVKHKLLNPPYDFGSAIFLDSGGYEISITADLSDVSEQGESKEWTEKEHSSVLAQWKPRVPSIIISYDHPKRRHSVKDQIKKATKIPLVSGDMAREILLKPETEEQGFIQIKKVIDHVHELASFEIIGVTEKEIGNSVLERMLNIARLRSALASAGLKTPIHVFGSLDSVTTLYYFVAGADIFDGLTWLRYAFKEGRTLYRQDFGISDLGISTKSYSVEAQCWYRNYTYMRDMQLEMERFPTKLDFSVFKYHSAGLEMAYKSVEAVLSKGGV